MKLIPDGVIIYDKASKQITRVNNQLKEILKIDDSEEIDSFTDHVISKMKNYLTKEERQTIPLDPSSSF